MKRFFILATAAIVALASCAKTEVVYKDGPQEIAFKKISGVMTKADPTLDQLNDGSMGVFANYYENSTIGEAYFVNKEFAKGTTYWSGGQYWPLSGELIFAVYAPHVDDATPKVVDWDKSGKTLTINADNASAQTDWLYGTSLPTGSKSSEHVDVNLAHALSLIEVNVTGENAKLISVELLQTVQKATGVVTYNNPVEVDWTPAASSPRASELTLWEPTGDPVPTSVDLTESALSGTLYVVPTTSLSIEAIRLTYTLGTSSEELIYTTKTSPDNDLGNTWVHGKKYIYNIDIQPKQILFDPTVTDWAAGNSGDTTISVN